MSFNTARLAQFLILLFVVVTVYASMQRAKKADRAPSVRPLPALEAIKEAVGRATEMGRPVLMVPGGGSLSDAQATHTMAGMAILEHVAELCATNDARLLSTVRKPDLFPLAQEVVTRAGRASGNPDFLKDDTVQFFSEEQFAWAMGTVQLMHKERVAAAIFCGSFAAETLTFAEEARRAGAISIGGVARLPQVPFFVICCDYCLIGEELLAAGAYLSGDKVQLGALLGQDISKAVALASILAGSLLLTGGSAILLDLLR